MRIVLYPYKMYSDAAKALQDAFEEDGYRCLRVYPDKKYIPKLGDVVINWGSSQEADWMYSPPNEGLIDILLNNPARVANAISKINSFKILDKYKISIPSYTSNVEVVKKWLEKEKYTVARELLKSSGGKGIKIIKTPEDIIEAPLYVEYIKKKFEYRVHVFKDSVIDVQIKMLKKDFPEDQRSFEIRNLSTGWIFGRNGIKYDTKLFDLAIDAVSALGLDFGAVDIIHNTKKGYFVLEVNSAPGLEGQTITSYKNAILEHINEL